MFPQTRASQVPGGRKGGQALRRRLRKPMGVRSCRGIVGAARLSFPGRRTCTMAAPDGAAAVRNWRAGIPRGGTSRNVVPNGARFRRPGRTRSDFATRSGSSRSGRVPSRDAPDDDLWLGRMRVCVAGGFAAGTRCVFARLAAQYSRGRPGPGLVEAGGRNDLTHTHTHTLRHIRARSKRACSLRVRRQRRQLLPA